MTRRAGTNNQMFLVRTFSYFRYKKPEAMSPVFIIQRYRLCNVFVLRYRVTEAFGHASQINQTDTTPDQTQNHGALFQVNPQCTHSQGTTNWQNQVVKVVFQRLVTLLTDPELRDNREVNEGKGHQRTEVDQRGCGYQVKLMASSAIAPTSSTFHAGVRHFG